MTEALASSAILPTSMLQRAAGDLSLVHLVVGELLVLDNGRHLVTLLCSDCSRCPRSLALECGSELRSRAGVCCHAAHDGSALRAVMLRLFAAPGFLPTRNTNANCDAICLHSSLQSIRAAHDGSALRAQAHIQLLNKCQAAAVWVDFCGLRQKGGVIPRHPPSYSDELVAVTRLRASDYLRMPSLAMIAR